MIAGKYRVERVLGEGGMGVVYEAEHVALRERVAIKLLHKKRSADAEISRRFVSEARTAVKIKSDAVARVLDVGTTEDGMPFIVDIGYYKDNQATRGEAYAAHSLLVVGMTYQRQGNTLTMLSLDTLDPSYVMIRQNTPNYSPRQRIDAKQFDTIQGMLGVVRK